MVWFDPFDPFDKKLAVVAVGQAAEQNFKIFFA